MNAAAWKEVFQAISAAIGVPISILTLITACKKVFPPRYSTEQGSKKGVLKMWVSLSVR
jgi:hypothetical protein